ncbi:hypothetical protein T484DRAFT_1819828 [Baffinella frigidus]|nr:hypothetical protein T484DRAFT_1819828 [Cryptophyta sp. CCMP2293]
MMLESIDYLKPVLGMILKGGVMAGDENENFAEENCENLTEREWALVKMTLEVLEPFMKAQEVLEGEREKRRKRTDPENLSLLLFLHNGWDLARELELLKL